jgi:hypothetical protein
MKLQFYIIIAVIILLAGGTAGFFIAKKIYTPKQAALQLPVYFPVVTTVTKYVEKPVPYAQIIPAHVTTHFLAYTDSMKLVKANDSLLYLVNVLASKKPDTVKIHTKFLTAFPYCPKLINIDLNMDSISITTLNINADLNTFRYPLALMGYQYRFDGKDMSVEKLKRPYGTVKPKIFTFEINAYAGYELLNKQWNASGEVGISAWKIKLVGVPSVTIETQPKLGMLLKLGYKFLN